jgi:hypothetical protein
MFPPAWHALIADVAWNQFNYLSNKAMQVKWKDGMERWNGKISISLIRDELKGRGQSE